VSGWGEEGRKGGVERIVSPAGVVDRGGGAGGREGGRRGDD